MITAVAKSRSKMQRGAGRPLTRGGRAVIIQTPQRALEAAPPRTRRSARTLAMPNEAIPSVVAMLVCDQVIIEQGTGKKSLIGVFERVNAFSFPTQTRLAIYAKLVDASGHYKFRIRLVNLKDESVLAELQAEANIDQGSVGEFAINIAGIVLPTAGKYEFQLYANEVYLHRVTMTAAAMPGGLQWPQQQQK